MPTQTVFFQSSATDCKFFEILHPDPVEKLKKSFYFRREQKFFDCTRFCTQGRFDLFEKFIQNLYNRRFMKTKKKLEFKRFILSS